jgi:hypothetical protein
MTLRYVSAESESQGWALAFSYQAYTIVSGYRVIM